MSLFLHPLWRVGFRPFFLLACLSGALLPLAWVLMYMGAIPSAPTFAPSMLQWHVHEMFYGFGWAALGGFLLTASKNWVGVRGWHGGVLAFLVLAWVLDRLVMSLGAGWPVLLSWFAGSLFQLVIVVLLLHTLWWQRVRGQESDNYYFWIILPLFIPAKAFVLNEAYYALGWSMSLALFRVAFLLMLERTQVQFMRGAFQVGILRDACLDHAIKSLAVLLVFGDLLPGRLNGGLEIMLALLLLGRFAFWHPQRAFTRLDIGIMYVGYLMIVAQLALSGIGRFMDLPSVGSVAPHLFTLGVMGLILPAMIVRISKGHTGRHVEFVRVELAVLWIMIFGLVVRVLAPQFFPAAYSAWLLMSASGWLLGFGILLWRFTPFMFSPRVDGREH